MDLVEIILDLLHQRCCFMLRSSQTVWKLLLQNQFGDTIALIWMGVLTGEETGCYLFFASLLNGSQLLMERICFSRSKFFPSRVDLSWKGFILQESKQNVTKVISLPKNGRKIWQHTPINRSKTTVPCHMKKVPYGSLTVKTRTSL